MFCPNCGEKLDTPNQSFCAMCGSKLQSTPIPKDIPVQTKESQVIVPVSSIPVSKSVPIKTGGPGSYSKRVFAFSFISLVLAGVGFGVEFFAFIKLIAPSYVFPRIPGSPILLIAALVIHLVGVIFGIVSRANSNKAKKHEIENTLEKVGSVFGILGIIANVIPLVAINILLVIMAGPLSPSPVPP